MMTSGESRQELLAWINDLLQLNYTRIEQCGTGAVHCAIIDSIYRDVPLSKVKFNAKQEYEYVQNFKVLQTAFDKHKIENHIPVERLIKCKFQDNLEFLQFVKKYWDTYYPGGPYDALKRRGATGSTASLGSSARPAKAAPVTRVVAKAREGPSASPASGAASSWAKQKELLTREYEATINDLSQQAMELKVSLEQVEKEREFYFNKLRDIEVFINTSLEGHVSGELEKSFKTILDVMYKTEEGFEVPE